MKKQLDYQRIGLHILFWALSLVMLTVVFGIKLPTYLISLRNNIIYLPVHIGYFYLLAYYLIPKFLLRKKYVSFISILILLVILVAVITRLLDIFFVDPYLDKIQKIYGDLGVWWKLKGSFWQQLTNPIYFMNAIRGSNFVVWFAVTIKLFKLWYERRKAALTAELNFLKGQVHPHFLFNTLNNLYALTLNQSLKAPNVVMGLSEILRYMLYECDKEQIELKRDVEILESYIALEQIRYEERLALSFSISGKIDEEKIAPLLLIPLVENAFKHGVGEQIGDAWIKIELSLIGQKLKFKVANSKTNESQLDKSNHHGNIGLKNLSKRLEIIYPDAHHLKIDEDQEIFLVILEIDLDKHVVI